MPYVKRIRTMPYKVRMLCMILVAILLSTVGLAQSDISPSFSQLDADEIGVFNIGLALGGVLRSFDETAGKEVLEFDYSVPKGSIIGVWTGNYPPRMGRDAVDAVRIGVKVPSPDQLRQVSVKVEIKGTKAMQKIPLHLEAGWNYFREAIDWNMIGNLKEVVFVVSPMVGGPQGINPMGFSPTEVSPTIGVESMEGMLYFDLDFYKLTFLQKNFIFVKVGLVLVLSLSLTLMIAFLERR